MKLFEPTDMEFPKSNPVLFRRNLNEVKLLCALIDRECELKGIEAKSIITIPEARRLCGIGCSGLNIPFEPHEILKFSWQSVIDLRRKFNKGKLNRDGTPKEEEPDDESE